MSGILEDRLAIVTGAGSGIGREMALLFHKEGATVVIVDVLEDRLKETAKLMGNGTRVHTITMDLRDGEAISTMIDGTVTMHGRIDILCNNAGIMDGIQPVDDTSDELWNRVMDINLNAPFKTIRAVIPHMLKQGHGVILNTASIAGLHGGRAGVAYTVSKHGLIGLTKSTAAFYGDKGVRCNAMALGAVQTNIGYGSSKPSDLGVSVMGKTFPAMPAPGDPKAVAKVALFLVSDNSEFLNGDVVVADGGWTVY